MEYGNISLLRAKILEILEIYDDVLQFLVFSLSLSLFLFLSKDSTEREGDPRRRGLMHDTELAWKAEQS